jgi:hypothetical protein
MRADVITDYTTRSKKNPTAVQNNIKPIHNFVAVFNVRYAIQTSVFQLSCSLILFLSHCSEMLFLGSHLPKWNTKKNNSTQVHCGNSSATTERFFFHENSRYVRISLLLSRICCFVSMNQSIVNVVLVLYNLLS